MYQVNNIVTGTVATVTVRVTVRVSDRVMVAIAGSPVELPRAAFTTHYLICDEITSSQLSCPCKAHTLTLS